jgi:ArsR family transcriptional regulator
MEYRNYASIYKALGDPTRAEIFDMLKGGCKCACEILEKFEITQPTLSYHMKIMCECGLVECKKIGTWVHYNLNSDILNNAVEFLLKNVTYKFSKTQKEKCDANC